MNFGTELDCDRGDVVDPKIDERAGSSIACVLRKMELNSVAIQEHVKRKARLETVLTDDLEPQPAIPLGRFGCIGDPKNWDHQLSHLLTVADDRLSIPGPCRL